MSLRDRYDEWILKTFEKKDENIDAVKEQQLEEVNRLAKDALTLRKERHSSRIFRDLQKVDNDSKKTLSKLRMKSTKSKSSKSVSLSTFSRSSAIFRVSTETFVAITSMIEITDSQEVADIRIFLRNHEFEILSLRIQLENTRIKVQNLHKQCRKAFEDFEKRSKTMQRGLQRWWKEFQEVWEARREA